MINKTIFKMLNKKKITYFILWIITILIAIIFTFENPHTKLKLLKNKLKKKKNQIIILSR